MFVSHHDVIFSGCGKPVTLAKILLPTKGLSIFTQDSLKPLGVKKELADHHILRLLISHHPGTKNSLVIDGASWWNLSVIL